MAPIDAEVEKLSDLTLEKFKNQNFDDIRTSCVSAGTKWTDPEFGPNDNSLGELLIKSWRKIYKKAHPTKEMEIEWKRVHEISSDARLFIQGYSEKDAEQGTLGDCWFVSSIASLALQHSLVKNVIPHPDQQELNGKNYCGVLLFRFHRFGKWIEVVVDDYLPTINNTLVLGRSNASHPNEFWASLVEKAYAKLDGSYEGIDEGSPADALSDLTGGMCERIFFTEVGRSRSERQTIYRQLKTALSRGAVVDLGVFKLAKKYESKGIYGGHAYSVLRCFDIPQDVTIPEKYMRELVKVRNPWGHEEWTGRWGDKDTIWTKIPQKIKRALDYENKNDGEYWMEFDDLVDIFTMMTICRIIKDDHSWHYEQIYSKWVQGSTAGGSFNLKNRDAYFTNPQFQFQIEHEHDETVLIVLEQPDTRSDQDKKNMSIAFDIFKVPEGNTKKVNYDTDSVTMEGKMFMYDRDSRQRCKRFELDVGTYVIIPSTEQPNVEGKFLLRILTENEAHVTELKD